MTDLPPTDLSSLRTQAAATALARKQTADALFEQAGKIDVVETDEDADRVGRLARRVKALLADIDEERKGYTRVLDLTKQGIMATYKPAIDVLTDSESHLKGVLDAARRVEQARLDQEAAEREAALQSAIADGDSRAVDAALEAQLTSPARDKAYMPAGTSVTRHLKVSVEDQQALLAFVLSDYATFHLLLTPYLPAIRDLAREALKEGRQVPGVRAWYETGVGVGSTR